MHLRWGILGLALALGFPCEPATPEPQPEMPVQNLSLVALDSHGLPVNDLKPEELVINDSGKVRKIAFLRHIEKRLAPSPVLGPNEFSNRAGSNIPHATVILLDLMNQSFNTRGVAANQLLRYLQSVESGEYLYLYLLTLEGKLYPVRGLPGAEGAEDGGAWIRNIKRTMDAALRAVTRVRPVDIDVAARTQLTYAALETLGSWMSETPGRKNIVWITDGVPLTLGPIRSDAGEVVDYTPLLRHLSQALDRSGIAIYPVPQIMLGSTEGPSDTPGSGPPGAASGLESSATLNQFAELTGGRPDSGKDIGAAISKAMNDAKTSYQIGYYMPMETQDGRFHKLRVTCTRKGVRIQTRTGYYAWAEDPDAETAQAFRAAITQPVDAAELGVRAVLVPSAAGMQLKVRIDAADVVLLNEADRYAGQVSFVLTGYDAGGAARTSPVRTVKLSYGPGERERALAEGIGYTVDVPSANDLTMLRFIALDDISHAIGSVTIRLKPAAR